MKARKIVFTVLEILFVAAVPAALIIWNYSTWGEGTTGFKISVTGILLLIIVFFVLKAVFLTRYLKRMSDRAAQHEADLKVETDEEKKENLRKALRTERSIEALLSYVMPLLAVAGLYVLALVLESAAVRLSGTFGLCAASMVIGFGFGFFAAREV